MNNSSVSAFPMDALENKLVSLVLQACKNLGCIEEINKAAFGILAKSTASEQEKEEFYKILGFLSCMVELVKDNKETFQDLQVEYQSNNYGILP